MAKDRRMAKRAARSSCSSRSAAGGLSNEVVLVSDTHSQNGTMVTRIIAGECDRDHQSESDKFFGNRPEITPLWRQIIDIVPRDKLV